MRFILAVFLIVQAGAAWADTDFGSRQVPGAALPGDGLGGFGFMRVDRPQSSTSDIGGPAQIAANWGRVTSTIRSPQHNRRVGGVRNSYHLSGRAIDIARRPGVRHADIAAAFRAAGYSLIESLDEGDHSHFAFGRGYSPTTPTRQIASGPAPKWKVVFAPQ